VSNREASVRPRPKAQDNDGRRRAQIAVTATFMAHALLFASWTAHIPQIKSQLYLSDASLGTALLGAPMGSVAAMAVSGWLLPRVGSHRMIQITIVGYAASGISVGLANSVAELFGALALWGLFQGSLDVAMNTQAVTVEKAVGRPIMSRLHGMWSVGGFSGALLGAAAVSLGIGLIAQLAALGVIAVIVAGSLSFFLLPDQGAPAGSDQGGVRASAALRLSPVVVILGGVAFASMLCEGAAADWSANYLHNELGTGVGFAGLGYAAYTLAMVAMRLSGTALQRKFASRTLLPALALISAAGLGIALAWAQPVVALIGFAALGIGLALVVPTAFSAAGVATGSGNNAGAAIATVAALGWIGYVCGPPLIGHLAQLVGLETALWVLPALTIVIAIVVRSTHAFTAAPDHATTTK
jgi:MFS family permease